MFVNEPSATSVLLLLVSLLSRLATWLHLTSPLPSHHHNKLGLTMLGTLLFATVLGAAGVRAGNTTCKTTSLDWYTNSVGESPCRTYERLRQTCNSQYQVGNFGPNPPGDSCDDQVHDCCCNSVAFALSMLCENCQYGIGSGVGGDTGFDGAAGTYQFYTNTCGVPTNQSLPNITQTAVCNQGINIPGYLYTLFWPNGDWYYEFTRQTANLQITSGKNTTRCPKTTASATASTASSTATSSNSASGSNQPSGPNIGAIVGGVVGGIGLIAIAALVWWFAKRRRSRGVVDLDEDKTPEMVFEPYVAPPSVAPVPYPHTLQGPASTSDGYTYTSASSDVVSNPGTSTRYTKPGMIASIPPNRDEPRPSMPAPVSSAYSSERHEDSTELSDVFGLGRSNSGRLPPSYQPR